MDDCQQRADYKDDVFSMGPRGPMDRPRMCCAQLHEFDWVVPHYDPDTLLSGRDMKVGFADINRDIRVLPDAFPVMFDKTAAVPMTLPVDVEMGPQVDDDPDDPDKVVIRRDVRNLPDVFPVGFDKTAAVPMTLPVDVEMGPQVVDDPDDPDMVDIRRDVRNLPDVFPVRFDKSAAVPMPLPVDVEMGQQVDDDPDVMLTGREVEVSDMDVVQDIRVLTSMFEESATVPLSLPVVVNTETQVDVKWEITPVVVSFGDGCGRPAGWLDFESDCCVVDEIVLDLEISPIVSLRSAAVPAFLLIMFEVFLFAVLAGGGVVAAAAPLAVEGQSQRKCRILGVNFQRILMLPLRL